MSGEELRSLARKGDHRTIRTLILQSGNPCSTDQYDLTPLMYAAWNGHVECVKYLACNDWGADKHGRKCGSLNMTSCRGYSALHLACMDCPYWSTREIVLILLAAGIDPTLVSQEGKVAYQFALENKNDTALIAFNYFKSIGEDPDALKKIEQLREELETKYTFTKRARLQVEDFSAKFDVPDFIFERQRAGCIPEGMTVFEHQIRPLMDDTSTRFSSSAIQQLEFTKSEAIISQQRRLKILKAADESWEPEADLPELIK